MREALVTGVSTLDAAMPRKSSGPARGKAKRGSGGRSPGWGEGFRRFRTKAALVVGSAGFSAIMIGIVLNATVMQKGHHPAPLFTHPADPPAPRAALVPPTPAAPLPVAAAPETPPAAPSPLPAVLPDPAPAAVAPSAPSRAVPQHPRPAARPAATSASKPHKPREDGIARLLGPAPAHEGASRTPATHVRPGSRLTTAPASRATAAPVTAVRSAPLAKAAAPKAAPAE